MLDNRFLIQMIAHKKYVLNNSFDLDKICYQHFMDQFCDESVLRSNSSFDAFKTLSVIYLDIKRSIKNNKKMLLALDAAYEHARDIVLKLQRFEQ